jgi:DNA polymerase V
MPEKNLEFYKASSFGDVLIPYFETGLKAGFPSPAEDYTELKIDLNRELIRNPDATFYARVKGKSMLDAGLADGDILVIDRSLEPVNGKIAVCYLDGGFTVKRIKIEHDSCWLVPENPDFKPILVTKDNDFIIWGIVTYVIKPT